jgi:hypothetical protein
LTNRYKTRPAFFRIAAPANILSQPALRRMAAPRNVHCARFAPNAALGSLLLAGEPAESRTFKNAAHVRTDVSG